MSNEMEDLQKIAHKWTVIFLGKNLPELRGKNWWQKRVIDKLSGNQENWVKSFKWSKLEDYDLGTVLHIFDSYSLSYPVLHCIWLHISDDPSYPIAEAMG